MHWECLSNPAHNSVNDQLSYAEIFRISFCGNKPMKFAELTIFALEHLRCGSDAGCRTETRLPAQALWWNGTDAPMKGDPSITSVSVKMIGKDMLEETDKRDGKAHSN
jgi:hypothetical protein